jgi:hypothetical protein
MQQNQPSGVAAFAATRSDLFAQGYFSSLMLDGIKPDFGYPKNHLPHVPANAKMDMELGTLV